MKMFRRISALALAVVMICLLSVSAFAAEIEDEFSEAHPVNGGEFIVMTSGVMYEDFFNADMTTGYGDAIGNYFRIDAAYQHYFDVPSNGCLPDVAFDEVSDDTGLYMTVVAPNFRKMFSATIFFDATVATSAGSDSVSYQADTLYSAAAQQYNANQG